MFSSLRPVGTEEALGHKEGDNEGFQEAFMVGIYEGVAERDGGFVSLREGRGLLVGGSDSAW